MLDNIADIVRGVASATLENRFGSNDGALKLFYNFGNHEINDGYTTVPNQGMPSVPLTPRDSLFRSQDKNFGALLYQNFRPFEGNLITGGLDFKTYGGHVWNKYLDNRPNREMTDTTVYELAAYLIAQQTLFDQLTLNAGLRLERNEMFGNEWIPQAGLVYRPWKTTVIKTSLSKGFRSPTIRELFLEMPAPNPNLRPEKMINYELSVEQSFCDGRLSAELTGYTANGENLVQVTRVGGRSTPVNTGKFNNKGVEFSLKWQLCNNLRLHGNYSYLHLDEPILAAPEQQAFLSTTYRLKKWSFNVSYQYIRNLYLLTGENPQKGSYGLLNAHVSYQPLKYLDFFIKGENLTDTDYEIVAGYPMPGVTVLGGIRVSL
jgi:iron complex outermembrane receptor protein